MPRQKTNFSPEAAALFSSGFSAEDIKAFRQRQQDDYEKRLQHNNTISRRKVFHKRFDTSNAENIKPFDDREVDDYEEGEESWRTQEGDRLADYGVDEEVEFYDEEDIPLAELVARRQKQRTD
jgi:palmitoyltransferase